MTDSVFQQAWEFQESQYAKTWTKVELTGRRRVTQGNPNYENGSVVEYEVEAGLYGTFVLESHEIIFKEYYLENRWVSESKIKILEELSIVVYKSDGTVEADQGPKP
jgi:hypothetical protein